MIIISNGLIENIQNHHFDYKLLQEKRQLIVERKTPKFNVGQDNILQICVVTVAKIRRSILEGVHKSKFGSYPNATKMYQDFKERYWWPGMKKQITYFIHTLLTNKDDLPCGEFIRGLCFWNCIPSWSPFEQCFDTELKFTSYFGRALHKALGKELRLSPTYRPQIDGHIKRTISLLQDFFVFQIIVKGWMTCCHYWNFRRITIFMQEMEWHRMKLSINKSVKSRYIDIMSKWC